jgi:hypothetical protein
VVTAATDPVVVCLMYMCVRTAFRYTLSEMIGTATLTASGLLMWSKEQHAHDVKVLLTDTDMYIYTCECPSVVNVLCAAAVRLRASMSTSVMQQLFHERIYAQLFSAVVAVVGVLTAAAHQHIISSSSSSDHDTALVTHQPR